MAMDRSLCAVCAWRGDCKKKFMQSDGVFCPDFTKDLTIKATGETAVNPPQDKKQVKKPPRGIWSH